MNNFHRSPDHHFNFPSLWTTAAAWVLFLFWFCFAAGFALANEPVVFTLMEKIGAFISYSALPGRILSWLLCFCPCVTNISLQRFNQLRANVKALIFEGVQQTPIPFFLSRQFFGRHLHSERNLCAQPRAITTWRVLNSWFLIIWISLSVRLVAASPMAPDAHKKTE